LRGFAFAEPLPPPFALPFLSRAGAGPPFVATKPDDDQLDYHVDATKTVSWNVVYASDPNVTGSSHCETTSLTITN